MCESTLGKPESSRNSVGSDSPERRDFCESREGQNPEGNHDPRLPTYTPIQAQDLEVGDIIRLPNTVGVKDTVMDVLKTDKAIKVRWLNSGFKDYEPTLYVFKSGHRGFMERIYHAAMTEDILNAAGNL